MATFKCTILGSGTLLGRELRDLTARAPFASDVRLIDAGVVSDDEEALPIMLSPESIDDESIVFLAANDPASRQAAEPLLRQDPAPHVIDLTYRLEDDPQARLRAPSVETDAPHGSRLHVIAHPAAVALSVFFSRLRKAGKVTRAVVHVFEPASERGQAGIDVLQKQTVGLLSFKPLSKEIYDAQLSFNMLARFGEDAPQSLESIEERIERHLATLFASYPQLPMPSLRLIQAPVFHAYSISVWAEFQENPGERRISEALASAQIDVRGAKDEPPTNVGVASQSGITVGAIEIDRNNPHACWFWIAADNIRIAAEEAVAVARGISEERR